MLRRIRLVPMTDVYRTPERRFARIADYPYEPHYFEPSLDPAGLRMHYVDEGEGEPVVFVHGEPTWGYLWREFIGPVVESGRRAIVPDLIGFGKSDKPTDDAWYSAEKQILALDELILELDLEDATIVVHDWGGPIGLRQAADMPERFKAVAITNTWLHNREYVYSEAIRAWHALATGTDFRDMPTGAVVAKNLEASPRGIDGLDVSAIKAAYDAPFLTIASKAGARRFPYMLPFGDDPELGNMTDQVRVFFSIRTFPGPVHLLWGAADDIFTDDWGREWADLIAGSTYDAFDGGAHFVQEQYGAEMAAKLVGYLEDEPG